MVEDPRPAARPRVWPVVVLLVAFWGWWGASQALNVSMFGKFMGMMGSTALLLILFLLAWSLDRRGRRGERLLGVAAFIVLGVLAVLLASKSFQPVPFLLFVLPYVITAWGLWALATWRTPLGVRRAGVVVILALAWGATLLMRAEGLNGEGAWQLRWRWSPTSEDRFLASLPKSSGAKTGPATTQAAVRAAAGDWVEFRGTARDGVVRGERIRTDWDQNPPKLVWRERVGPAWSSIVIVGGRVYSQEQRGASEAVVCRDAAVGHEIWAYADPVRFDEALSGIGPRATPTFVDGRIYALGAKGMLNCLDAATGAKRWAVDVLADTKAKLPIWGFSSSPLVVDGRVIVFAGGDGANGLVAYDAETGARAWGAGGAGQNSYSSAQLADVAGQRVALFWGEKTLVAADLKDGSVKWSLEPGGMFGALQPHVIGGDRLVLACDSQASAVSVRKDGERFTVEPVWQTGKFHPQFNDFVVHEGNAYGLSGGNAVCIDLGTGKERWRKGRYGYGQLLLLAEQGLLVVACESGEVALVAARPEGHKELGRFQAVEGKTWANPALVRGRIYVRSAEEMACFDVGG